MLDFLKIPAVAPTIIAALTYLGHKLIGAHADSKLAHVTAAIGEATAQMAQAVLTAPSTMTPDQVIIECKGLMAVVLAKYEIYERDRAPYEPLISKAIAEAVQRWYELHPSPKSPAMTPPALASSIYRGSPSLVATPSSTIESKP